MLPGRVRRPWPPVLTGAPIWLLLLVLAVVGCAGPQDRQGPAAPGGEQAAPPPGETGGAVLALLGEAGRAERAADLETTEALLERALRIEPRNPALWHYLARLRLRQGRLQESLAMAAKSNALAGDNQDLQAANWRLMGDAHEALGASERAAQARARAAALAPP